MQPSPRTRYIAAALSEGALTVFVVLVPFLNRSQLYLLLAMAIASLVSLVRRMVFEIGSKLASTAGGGLHISDFLGQRSTAWDQRSTTHDIDDSCRRATSFLPEARRPRRLLRKLSHAPVIRRSSNFKLRAMPTGNAKEGSRNAVSDMVGYGLDNSLRSSPFFGPELSTPRAAASSQRGFAGTAAPASAGFTPRGSEARKRTARKLASDLLSPTKNSQHRFVGFATILRSSSGVHSSTDVQSDESEKCAAEEPVPAVVSDAEEGEGEQGPDEFAPIRTTWAHAWRLLWSRVKQFAFEEPLNVVDALAITSVVLLLLNLLLDPGFHPCTARDCDGEGAGGMGYTNSAWLALTAHLILLRHLRMLTMSPSLGPLLLITKLIWIDFFKFVTLFVFSLVPFAGALYLLFLDIDLTCPESHHTQPFVSFGTTVAFLLEATVNMQGEFECVHASERGAVGIAILHGYVITAVLLLANMLIASMAHTFDDVYSEQEKNFAFQNARVMLFAQHLDTLPPPFNLLTVPFYAARALLLLGSLGYCDFPSPRLEDSNESDGNRPEWINSWKLKARTKEVSAAVLEFVTQHDNQQAPYLGVLRITRHG